MSQFGVHRNPNPDTNALYPLLLDVQSDIIEELGTRVVVPLCTASVLKGRLIDTLTPVVVVDGKKYVMLTPQLASVAKRQLGSKVGDLAGSRAAILAALDLLFTGI